MNILPNYIQYNRPAFYANKEQLDFPAKIPLTETEQKFDVVLKDLHRLESDIYVQKQNLRDMYSAQDRYDYKELLKKRRTIIAKLKRMAKKEAKEYYEIEFDIEGKKQYNRFAPKIMRAQSKEELQQVVDLISSYSLFAKTKEMLKQIILKKKF